MFTDRKTTAKRVQSWLLTLLLGARSQGQGSGESGSNSNAAKKGAKPHICLLDTLHSYV